MEEESYLIFRDGKHFFQKFIKKNFGHITILKKDKFNWFRVEPYNDRILFEILPFASDNDAPLQNYLKEVHGGVLRIRQKIITRDYYSLSCFHFMNCVSVCKYILGIKNMCCTPYSLYEWLIRNVGEQGILEIEKLN